MTALGEAIAGAKRVLDLYERVHLELDEGRAWESIDDGMMSKRVYDVWLAYMQQRLINELRAVVLVAERRKDDE